MKKRIFAYGTSLLLAALGSGPAGTKAQPAPAAKPLAANVLMLLTPKENVAYLQGDNTLRQGLERMRAHGYTAVPVLDENETYMGSVTEGDFLRHVLATGTTDFKSHEQYRIGEIFRKNFCKPLHIFAPMSALIQTSLEQNFVPIVDDRNCLCGIVTRRSLISFLSRRLEGQQMGVCETEYR